MSAIKRHGTKQTRRFGVSKAPALGRRVPNRRPGPNRFIKSANAVKTPKSRQDQGTSG